MLGGCKFTVRCTDGFTRCMSIMKPMQRRADCICRTGDIVLIQRPLYTTADSKCYLGEKLTPPECKQVRREGSVPSSWAESGVVGEEDAQNLLFEEGDAALLEGLEEEAAAGEDEVDMADL